jgi:hypothetical protein
MIKSKAMREIDTNLALRLQHAMTAGNEEIYQVITDHSMDVLRAVLKNPLLGEDHLLVLLRRCDLVEDILKAVYRLSQVSESHRLKVALVHNPNTPGPIVLSLLPHLHLFELVAICLLPGVSPDQRLAAERTIVQRLPLTPLGNKLTLARRGTANVVGAILKDGEPALMDACLSNPRLRESDIFLLIDGPNATAATISAVARNPRWQTRLNLKLAILKNQKTPQVWLTVFLPTLPTSEVKNLLVSSRITSARKKEVERELKRRGLR